MLQTSPASILKRLSSRGPCEMTLVFLVLHLLVSSGMTRIRTRIGHLQFHFWSCHQSVLVWSKCISGQDGPKVTCTVVTLSTSILFCTLLDREKTFHRAVTATKVALIGQSNSWKFSLQPQCWEQTCQTPATRQTTQKLRKLRFCIC